MKIMNAAGTCKDMQGIKILEQTLVDEITLGSITLLPREQTGNFSFDDETKVSYNDLGLPNRGLAFYRLFDQRDFKKPMRVSLAGFSLTDFVELVKGVSHYASTIELNLSCPNADVVTDMYGVVNAILPVLPTHVRLAVKISPKGKFPMFLHHRINELVVCNTLDGFGGGPLRHIALNSVSKWKSYGVDIIGVGGIFTGEHAREYIDAGCTGVQIGTALYQFGPRVFEEIVADE